VHGQLRAPKTAHARLVEANIVLCNVLLQRVVDVGVPRASEQATLSALLFRKRGAQADVPSAALFVRPAFVEATGDGRRHNLQVVVRDAPVQPADLDAFLPALLDDLDERLDGLDALAVVVEDGVDKVVLHVDNDKQGGVGINQDTAVVADAIVGVEGDLALAAAREIEAFRLWIVEPLVISAWEVVSTISRVERFLEWTEDFDSTEGDVVIDVMFDVDIFLCQDQVVDVFDFVDGGRRGCHVTLARSGCWSESVIIKTVNSWKSVELLSWQDQADALVRASEKEGTSWVTIQKSQVIDEE
jgi:hypothetical protein